MTIFYCFENVSIFRVAPSPVLSETVAEASLSQFDFTGEARASLTSSWRTGVRVNQREAQSLPAPQSASQKQKTANRTQVKATEATLFILVSLLRTSCLSEKISIAPLWFSVWFAEIDFDSWSKSITSIYDEPMVTRTSWCCK